eukprot:9086962-Karenia_brevis.AAC.1
MAANSLWPALLSLIASWSRRNSMTPIQSRFQLRTARLLASYRQNNSLVNCCTRVYVLYIFSAAAHMSRSMTF